MATRKVGFSREAAEGMPTVTPQQIAHALSEQRNLHGAEMIMSGAQKMCRITNRAQKGNVKHFLWAFNGIVYPEGATLEDKSTCLAPGDNILVPLEVGMHVCGNFLAEKVNDRDEIIRRHGDWEYEGVPLQGMAGGRAPQNIVGPPPLFPDLLIVQIDQRGREMGEPVAIYDRYLSAQKYGTRMRADTAERDAEQLRERVAEFA